MTDDAVFSEEFAHDLLRLMRWRRDVRHFQATPIARGVLEELVAATRFAPSVGYSQPWRFLSVESVEHRAAVIASFERANAEALAEYHGHEAQLYAQLKLDGLREAPVHLAVFCDSGTRTGKGLGARTMPETLAYSSVMAIYSFWLLARTRGIGVGWVSILDPREVHAQLGVADTWEFIAYLCVGYPKEAAAIPELHAAGWENPDDRSITLERR